MIYNDGIVPGICGPVTSDPISAMMQFLAHVKSLELEAFKFNGLNMKRHKTCSFGRGLGFFTG